MPKPLHKISLAETIVSTTKCGALVALINVYVYYIIDAYILISLPSTLASRQTTATCSIIVHVQMNHSDLCMNPRILSL